MRVKKRSPDRVKEIKKLRMGRGFFTYEDMAQAITERGVHMTRQSYSNKENGITKFSVDEIEAMADILGLSLASAVDFLKL